MADKAVAEILEVKVPEFGLKEVGKLLAAEVRFQAADLKNLVSTGAKEAVLARLKLRGKKLGSTKAELSLKAMDDEQGEAMSPQLISGQLEVK